LKRLIFLAVVFSAITFIIYQILQFAISIANPKSRLKRDLIQLRKRIQPLLENMIPFSDEEMKLLSVNKSHCKKSYGLRNTEEGVFTSIYQEDALAYIYKSYNDHRALLLVTTTQNEFVYFFEGNQTEAYINDKLIGTINIKGELKSPENEILAKIDGDDVLTTHPVFINGREVGEVRNPKKIDSTSNRVYIFVEDMSADEKNMFMSLTLVNLVLESL
jgi:hypothetical protein